MEPVTPPYNPQFGDEKECVAVDPETGEACGHPYYRHFDTYEDMLPVGCKYCGCRTFAVKDGRLNDKGEVELFLPF